jgi:hypothetical protein
MESRSMAHVRHNHRLDFNRTSRRSQLLCDVIHDDYALFDLSETITRPRTRLDYVPRRFSHGGQQHRARARRERSSDRLNTRGDESAAPYREFSRRAAASRGVNAILARGSTRKANCETVRARERAFRSL